MNWNTILMGTQIAFFCLGAYYFFKSSRKRSKIKSLTFEDNVLEQDRLACMREEGLTEPLAEQTRPKALMEIIGRRRQSAPCVRRSAVPIRSMSSFTDRPAWAKRRRRG